MGWPIRIPVGVGQQPQLFELGGLKEVGFINDQNDAAVSLSGLGGEQIGGLDHQLGSLVAGVGAEGSDDGDIQAPGAEGGIGDVDDLVPGRVEGRDGGPD